MVFWRPSLFSFIVFQRGGAGRDLQSPAASNGDELMAMI
jgi:hypothetical protein